MSNIHMNHLPKIGLGTFLSTGEEAYHSVRTALETGYRLIDTAAVYENEKEVGKAIADSGIARKDIVVSTKLYAKKTGYQQVIQECKKSLKNLNLEYVDIYFIHWMPRSYEDLLDTWRGMEYLYEKGYCRAIGVCNITLYYLDRLVKDAKISPMFCQIEFHPFLQQTLFLEYCRNHKITVIGFGLFAKGLVFQNDTLKKLADFTESSVANLVLSWGMKCGVLPLVKSVHPQRIQDNYEKNFDVSTMLMEELTKLNDGLRVYRDPENNPYV